LQAYGLAVAASILAILISPANLIGLPIGIWALVVLSQRDVRAAFRRNRSGSASYQPNTESESAPVPGPLHAPYTGIDFRSKAKLFGWPLLHMTTGFDPATGRPRTARGIVAVSDGRAIGLVAMGGTAIGGFAWGGIAVGLIAMGGVAGGVF
jgi:hypothetical protein